MRRVLLIVLIFVILLLAFVAFRYSTSEDPTSASLLEVETMVPAEQDTQATVFEGEPAKDEANNSLSVDQLANMAYQSEWPSAGQALMVNGIYQESYGEESASGLIMKLSEMKAFGDLNADGLQDAAVILVSDPGGSGIFYDLATVINQDGEAQHVGSQFLGDRVQVQKIAIENNEIVLQMVTHSEEDALCCPTQQVTQRYQQQDNQLVNLSAPAEAHEEDVAVLETPQVEESAVGQGAAEGESSAEGESTTGTTTNIVAFLPAIPEASANGTCWANSLIIQQANAWRCSLESGQIYDPCLIVDENQTIVCGADPISGEPGVRLNLTEPLPEPTITTQDALTQAWLLELADGTICSFATGATLAFDERRVNYNCEDNSNLLGELQNEGDIWRAERVIIARNDEGFFIQESQLVPIASLWNAAAPGAAVASDESGVDAVLVNQQADAEPITVLSTGLTVEAVTVNAEGLAASLQSEVVSPRPVENGLGHPNHIKLSLKSEEAGPPSLHKPHILIYPVDEYRAMFDQQGIDEVGERIDFLNALLSDSPPAILGELPVLPLQNGTQAISAKLNKLPFQNGSGLRFITHYAQNSYPVLNGNILYTYQGLTNDGQYYISVWYPLSTASLPNTYDESPMASNPDEFSANFPTYIEETQQMLNGLPADSYTPSLEQLDAMVQSLGVGE